MQAAVKSVMQKEIQHGLQDLNTYLSFQFRADKIKDDLLSFLIEQKRAGKKVAAYGAAAKGNTLLNYAGVKPDLVEFVCDLAQAKQNKFMPGSHIPICDPNRVNWSELDFVVVLPWNIASEVKAQLSNQIKPGTLFVTAIPNLKVSL